MSRVKPSVFRPDAPDAGAIEMFASQLDSVSLPERYLLPPGVGVVEDHIESLYPADVFEQHLADFARPNEELFEAFLSPHVFRRVFSDLVDSLKGSGTDEGEAAWQQLRELKNIMNSVGTIKHLLHKV